MQATALVLSWLAACGAVGLLPICTGNVTDINKLLEQAVQGIDPKDFEFQFSPDDDKIYSQGLLNEDIHLNTTQLLAKNNYPVEEHDVITSDGYILKVVRMPKKGKPVFLMHGLLNSADDFLTVNLPNAVAYNLWLDGYDVWMGNARGNKYSRRHVTLNPDVDAEFWNFSWHEIGYIDVPTMIDYVLNHTSEPQLAYVGHSQGTTSYFVMASEKPEYNEKVSVMVAMSAVAWMSHVKSPVVKVLTTFSDDIEILTSLLGVHEVLPSNDLTKLITTLFCSEPNLAALFCSNVMFTLTGFDYQQIELKTLPVIFGHIPAGSSTMQILHYLQEVKSGQFRQYDHGAVKNLALYGSQEPPNYNVSKITTPVAVMYSDNDWLSSYTDVQILLGKLPNVIDVYHVPLAKWCHMDYLYAKDLKTLVYSKLLGIIKKYT